MGPLVVFCCLGRGARQRFGRWLTSVSASKLPESQPGWRGQQPLHCSGSGGGLFLSSSSSGCFLKHWPLGSKTGRQCVGGKRSVLPRGWRSLCLSWRRSRKERHQASTQVTSTPLLFAGCCSVKDDPPGTFSLDRVAPHVHRTRRHPLDAGGIPVDDVHRLDGHLGAYPFVPLIAQTGERQQRPAHRACVWVCLRRK